MADTIQLSAAIGTGAVLATQDESSVHYQEIKLTASGSGTTEALSKAEDTAHSAGEHGIMSLAVRRDADTSLVGTTGDYAPLQVDANGYLKVEIFDGGGSHTVDNAGTFATQATLQAGTAEFGKLAAGTAEIGNVKNAGVFVVQEDGAAKTALEIIDNIVHVDDAAYTLGTDSGVMMMGFAGTQSVNANDAGAIAMETDGSIHIHDGGNTITVDGTVTANPASGTIDTVTTVTAVTDITNTIDSTISGDALTALQLIDDPVFADNAAFTLSTSKTMVAGGVYQNGTPGTLADNDVGAILLNSTAGQMVELMASSAVIGSVVNAGTFATQATLQAGTAEIGKLAAGTAAIGKLAANSGVDIGDVDVLSLPASTNTLEVVGDVAHDAAAAGNPVAIAARATNSIEGLTQVAAADASYITSDLNGCLVTRNGTTLEEIVSFNGSNTDGAEDIMTDFSAGGAGVHNYVTAVTVHNAHASTNGFINLLDGSGGTVLWTFPAPATGGTTMRFDPPLKQPTANTALYFDPSAAITTTYMSANGYQAQG